MFSSRSSQLQRNHNKMSSAVLWTLFRFSAIEDNRTKPNHDDHEVRCRGSHASLRAPGNTLFGWLSNKYYLNLAFPEGKNHSKNTYFQPFPLWHSPHYLSKSILITELNKCVLSGRHACQIELLFSLIPKSLVNHQWLSLSWVVCVRKALLSLHHICTTM